jgi:FAD/FMN-containing dehydrogenase
VQTAVDFARGHGLRLVPRSGAHSFAGYSSGDGSLVVDLSRLTGVRVDSGAERARLGAGTTVLPAYRALWPHRRAISGGTCPTVGITGLMAGGGLGFLSRRYGLTCDGLLEVEIVTADGKLRRASERENQDLYWATRGGGGGNFGVITAMTFELVPVDMPFTNAEYAFPWKAAERVLAAWQDWLPTAPRDTSCLLEVLTQPPLDGASPTIGIEVVHAGSAAATLRIVACSGPWAPRLSTATSRRGRSSTWRTTCTARACARRSAHLPASRRRGSFRGRLSTRSRTLPKGRGQAMA